jgi:lipopolysaccharide/colanic/teichoic acid biosynthesis glycosyltransferase
VLLFLLPVILITALAVKLTSRGPVLFRQRRVGKGGTNFMMWKFRTMRADCEGGPSVTKVGDNRLTPIGVFLRRYKLDELPQLVNVIRGEMSLVGPRPKVPHHETQPLRYKPGVTGAASLAFRKEEELLHRLPDHSLDDFQVHVMMPLKRKLDDQYMRGASLLSDLSLMLRTVLGKGELVKEGDLLNFQESLVSLNSALSASAGSFVSPEPRQTPDLSQITVEAKREHRHLLAIR